MDARDIGRNLNARYLVEGSVQRAGDRLRVTAQLLDASSGSGVWSLRLERHMGDIFELEDEISGKVTDAIGVSLTAEPAKTSPQGTPKLDAYLAYIEGRSLLSTFKIADAQAGIERLKRATTIDPNFAAAYAEEAHALRFLSWLLHPDGPTDPELERQAAALNDKALSLDPELGEAWVERAYGRQQLAEGFDATTDADFRKGLALAPNYAQGYELYGEWLSLIGRTDDALAMIERARQLDPLSPRSHYFKGLMQEDDDQAVPLFLEALRVNPKYHPALVQLSFVEYSRGNFAEATKFLERAIAVDPKAEWMRVQAVMVYLSLGDVAAARDVFGEVPPRAQSVCLLSYLGQEQRAAAQLYALPPGELKARVLGPAISCASAVIRDDALKRGDYGRARQSLEVCLTEDWASILSNNYGRTICAVRYASILMAEGERDRAAKLLHTMLTAMGRNKHFISEGAARARGEALALLGDTEGALTALETAYTAEKWAWWYDIDHAPELQGLRAHPRFQSLARQVNDNAAKQAALLAAMRGAGEVPYRPPSSASAR
jgi:tetratricopeptide (TPR) repeat protein